MLELPEALTIAKQVNDMVAGKRIVEAAAAHTPHKFAWYYGDPQLYKERLKAKTIGQAHGYGGFIEIKAEDTVILIGDGVGLRYHRENEKRPSKHQLLIEFEDSSALSATVQMYGGLWCFSREENLDNPYYRAALEKPSPLSGDFDRTYFDAMISAPEVQKLSAKAFLATEQRIPGLGNGVLQDILYNAKLHPKKKVSTLSGLARTTVYGSIKSTLAEMTAQGGRDTEKDLFGRPGGYITRLSKNTAGKPCRLCGGMIRKETYLGGSIYYCEGCQKI